MLDNKELEKNNLEEFSLDDIYGTDFFKDLELQLAEQPETASEEASLDVDLESEDWLAFLSDEPAAMEPAVMEEIPVQPDVPQQLEFDLEERLSKDAEQPLVKVKRRRQKMTWQRSLLTYIHDLVFLLAAIIVIFLMIFRVVVVSGRSMNNTLYDGDYLLLLSNMFYHNPQQGDIIVASKDSFKDGAPIVKRIIATEGQTVDIDFDRGVVIVDGQELVEPYTKNLTTRDEGMDFPQVVPEGCVFVLGDNRDDSKDSRHMDIGFIKKEEIMGKVIFLFFPGNNFGQYDRDFGRIGAVA